MTTAAQLGAGALGNLEVSTPARSGTISCLFQVRKKAAFKKKKKLDKTFIGRTDTEASILWPPDAKSQLIGKDPDAGKDGRQEKKGATEDEMVGWYHRLDGHGFGWTLGLGDGQGGLACCGSWGRRESDMTEQLN